MAYVTFVRLLTDPQAIRATHEYQPGTLKNVTAILTSLLIAFGATNIHVTECQRGAWCRGTADTVMRYDGPSSCWFRAWPPYFDPVIVYQCHPLTKAQMVQRQYGAALRSGLGG